MYMKNMFVFYIFICHQYLIYFERQNFPEILANVFLLKCSINIIPIITIKPVDLLYSNIEKYGMETNTYAFSILHNVHPEWLGGVILGMQF